MADPMTPTERSKQMSLVKAKNTKPEIEVKKIFWSLGYRYKLTNVSGLPGKPDIVFKQRKKAIFVHGCFWHRHEGCPNNRIPKSNIDFWLKKFEQNIKNDEYVYNLLTQMGWRHMIIWECMLKKRDREKLLKSIDEFMSGDTPENRW